MDEKIIYLDNAATTRVDDEVVRAMQQTISKDYGNPSSLHSCGLLMHRRINQAVDEFKKRFGKDELGNEKRIIFTSCGTESNNLALFGVVKNVSLRKDKFANIITTRIEHPSILEPIRELEMRGFKITYLDVDNEGIIDTEQFKAAVNEDTVLISIMHANNELGSIQPIKELIKIARKDCPNAIFHTDASQTFLKLNIDEIKDADLITISAHKIHGPKGIGALVVNERLIQEKRLSPIFFGGHQQDNIRSGTQNTPGIVGFSEAIKKDMKISFVNELSDYLVLRLKEIKDKNNKEIVKINGPKNQNNKLRNIINILLPNIEGEVMLHHLEQDNIFVSTGSACSASKKEPSYVLKAIGLKDNEARCCIRLSLSKYNTREDIDFFMDKLKKYLAELKNNN